MRMCERGPADIRIVIIQNTSAPEDKDNIGIGEFLSRLPPRVLSAVFGVPAQTFSSFKKIDKCDPHPAIAVVNTRCGGAPESRRSCSGTESRRDTARGCGSARSQQPTSETPLPAVGRSTCDLNRTG